MYFVSKTSRNGYGGANEFLNLDEVIFFLTKTKTIENNQKSRNIIFSKLTEAFQLNPDREYYLGAYTITYAPELGDNDRRPVPRPPREIYVLHNKTGAMEVFPSINEVCRYHGIPQETFRDNLKRNPLCCRIRQHPDLVFMVKAIVDEQDLLSLSSYRILPQSTTKHPKDGTKRVIPTRVIDTRNKTVCDFPTITDATKWYTLPVRSVSYGMYRSPARYQHKVRPDLIFIDLSIYDKEKEHPRA